MTAPARYHDLCPDCGGDAPLDGCGDFWHVRHATRIASGVSALIAQKERGRLGAQIGPAESLPGSRSLTGPKAESESAL